MLAELRQWGRDQDAISSVYKALRRVENLDLSEESTESDLGVSVCVWGGDMGGGHLGECV